MKRFGCIAFLLLPAFACSSDPAEEPATSTNGVLPTADGSTATSLSSEDGSVSDAGPTPSTPATDDSGTLILTANDASASTGGNVTYGELFTGGQFHLGPVDYEETVWKNACAPGTKYAQSIRQEEGQLLAGLWDGIPNVAGYCDACIRMTTDKGKTALLRVVTYGATTKNSVDVSPAAYKILNSGEYPRMMTWQFAKCDDTGKIHYEFKPGSHEYWTSFWIRNARVPLAKVEVKSPNHASFFPLKRSTDGTLTDDKGFGKGPFTLRLTGVDGSVVTDTFDWPSGGVANKTLDGAGNFQ